LSNDQVSSGVLFIVGLGVCVGSLTYDLGSLSSPMSGFMPFLTGGVIIFFSAVGFIHATMGKKQRERWVSSLQGLRWGNPFLIFASLLAYALLLVPLGFLLCTILFIAFLLRAIVPKRWPVVIAYALLTAFASYMIFEVWLKAQLPKGFLGI